MAQKVINPNLMAFRLDLEAGPIKTLPPIFTPVSVSTCIFHIAQAHLRKTQSLGLVEHYISDEEYGLLLRCFAALTFVNETRVVEYFNLISQSVPEDALPAVFDSVQYISVTYEEKCVREQKKMRMGVL